MACWRNVSNASVVLGASPCDLIRERMKLVGFLLHPISRSETWRRLFLSRANRRAGCGTKQTPQKLLAQSRMRTDFHLVSMPISKVPNTASAAKPVYLIGEFFSTFLTGNIFCNCFVCSYL